MTKLIEISCSHNLEDDKPMMEDFLHHQFMISRDFMWCVVCPDNRLEEAMGIFKKHTNGNKNLIIREY